MKARIPLIAALAVTLAPLKASAQAWVSNPDFSEGVGIRAGNLELHPSAGAEFGYDSNYFRASKAEGVIDVYKLRLTPSFSIRTLGAERRNANTPPNYNFTADGNLTYHEVFPAGSEQFRGPNKRSVGAGVAAKLDVFPARKFGFDVEGGYVRIVQTDGSSDDLAGDGFNRGTARGGAGVTWRPGGGLFEWRVGYTGTYNYFDDAQYDSLTNVRHDINSRGRWRFLPRSALMFDTDYIFVRYTKGPAETQQTNGDIVRARVGFHGLVTYHLSLLGLVGWTSSFYREHQGSFDARQFDSVVAHTEARWFLQSRPDLESATVVSGLSSVALGYIRSFNNSYYGSFYQSDRGYMQFSAFVLGAVVAGLDFGVARVAYPDSGVDRPAFNQLRLDGSVFGEYRFTDTLAANATVQYNQVNSDPIPNDDLSYTRWQAYVGLRWFM